MNFRHLLESISYVFDKNIYEMTNLQPQDTGLKATVNVLVGGKSKHAPRVKVSNIAGTFHPTDNFSVTTEDEPRVIGNCKLKQEHLNKIKQWIKLNKNHIHTIWHHGGEMSIHDTANGFKKIDS